ncbi:hypothetical protein [Microvirga brassicacearum]|uniref:hypothetical protein n=1 Tax=Microvirga brassicacearum TaxID=2580413 RepID=UPI003B84735B
MAPIVRTLRDGERILEMMRWGFPPLPNLSNYPVTNVREHLVFSFLTTDANAEVGAIHPKAMPAILTHQDEFDAWLAAPMEEALTLQRPLPDGALNVVARGEREDGLVSLPLREEQPSLL